MAKYCPTNFDVYKWPPISKTLLVNMHAPHPDHASPWLGPLPRWRVNWHDVKVGGTVLLGIMACMAVMAALLLGGSFFLLTYSARGAAGLFALPLGIGGICALLGIPGAIILGILWLIGCRSLKVRANEVVKQALSGEGGLIQRVVDRGSLTGVDISNFIVAYEELGRTNFCPRMPAKLESTVERPMVAAGKSVFTFDPNSMAMAKVLHYLFLYGSSDTISDAIKFINDIAVELCSEAAERIFGECRPYIKNDEQLCHFLSAFLECQSPKLADIWHVIFDASRPDGALINKLADISAADDGTMQNLRELLACNPAATGKLLNGDFKDLGPSAIILYAGITGGQSVALTLLAEKFKSNEVDRETTLNVLRVKDQDGNPLIQMLFSIIPEGRQLAYKILSEWDVGDLLSLKNDAGVPLIVCLLSACTDAEQQKQFLDFMAKLPPEKQISLLGEKDHNGSPLIICLLSRCGGVEQWKQFLDFVAKFPPEGQTSLLNEKDHDGHSLVELLNPNIKHTPIATRLMKIFACLKNADLIGGVDFSWVKANSTFSEMLEIIGVNPVGTPHGK
jgi:hypothetical protein